MTACSEQDAVNSFFMDRALRRFDILSFVEHEDDGNTNRNTMSEAAC